MSVITGVERQIRETTARFAAPFRSGPDGQPLNPGRRSLLKASIGFSLLTTVGNLETACSTPTLLTSEQRVDYIDSSLKSLMANKNASSLEDTEAKPDYHYSFLKRALQASYTDNQVSRVADVSWQEQMASLINKEITSLRLSETPKKKSPFSLQTAWAIERIEPDSSTKVDLLFLYSDRALNIISVRVPYGTMIEVAAKYNTATVKGKDPITQQERDRSEWALVVATSPSVEVKRLENPQPTPEALESINFIEKVLEEAGIKATTSLSFEYAPTAKLTGVRPVLAIETQIGSSDEKKLRALIKRIDEARNQQHIRGTTREMVRRALEDAEWSFDRPMAAITDPIYGTGSLLVRATAKGINDTAHRIFEIDLAASPKEELNNPAYK